MKPKNIRWLIPSVFIGMTVYGLRQFSSNPLLSRISDVEPPTQTDGNFLESVPDTDGEDDRVFVSSSAFAFPRAGSPYSPITRIPARLLLDNGDEQAVTVKPSHIVPDETDAFTSDTFYAWNRLTSRLLLQSAVRINHTKRTGSVVGGFASIGTTMINSDGDVRNRDALWIPGSNCFGFVTEPQWNQANRWYSWSEGIGGQFAAEQIAAALMSRKLAEQRQSTWYVTDESRLANAVVGLVSGLTPAPFVMTRNIWQPDEDSANGANGYLYRISETRSFPNKAFGIASRFRRATDKPTVALIPADFSNPLLGLLPIFSVRFIQSYRVESGAVVPQNGPLTSSFSDAAEWYFRVPLGPRLDLQPKAPGKK